MTCEERKDLILLYAADALDEAEHQELRAHLGSGCARCAQELVDAEDTLARLPDALDPVDPPKSAENRLMRRVIADKARGGMSSGFTWLTAAKAACIGMVIGGVIIYALQSYRQDHELDQALALVSDRDQKLADVNAMLASEKLKFVQIAAAQQESRAFGRVIWDQEHSKWHVFVFDLQPPPQGKTYQLWFIKPDQTAVSAGLFMTDQQGKATVTVDVPTNLGPLAAAGVSEEPAGGSRSPTLVRLVGAIQ